MDGYTYLTYDYPLLGAFWTLMWLFLWGLWLFLLIRIIGDIFRDDSLGGWAKTGWLIFVIVLPFLGVFGYLLSRGKGMGRREAEQAQARQQALDSYIRETASGADRTREVDALAKLSDIRARGDISDEEFHRAKEKILH